LFSNSAAFADLAEVPASEMPTKPPEPTGPVEGLPPPQPQSGPSVDSDKLAKDAVKRAKQCQKLLAQQDKTLKLDDQAVAAVLGQCKEAAIAPVGGGGPVMLSPTNCPSTPAVFTYDATPHLVVSNPISLNVNDLFRVSTTNLASMPSPSSSSPDTVVYLLQCDNPACFSGNVLVADDDGNNSNWQYASWAQTNVPSTGWYRYIVTSYTMGNEGRADITVVSGSTTTTLSSVYYGALHISPQEVRAGDSLLVGKNNNTNAVATPPIGMPGNPEYHDTMMVMLSNFARSCQSSCGRFLFNDDAWSVGGTLNLLSRLLVATNDQTNWSASRIMVGGYYDKDANQQPYMINVRAMHYRRHTAQSGQWTCDPQRDADGDGLSQEIEAVVGSCDSLDSQCRSHWCDLGTGTCDVARGACGCTAHSDCVADPLVEPTSCTALGYCKSVRTPFIEPPVDLYGAPWKPRESAQFDGNSSPKYIKLGNIGSTSPLNRIDTVNTLRIQFNFRWNGGTGTQVLFNSLAFVVSLVPSGAKATLNASAGGASVAEQPNGIDAHRWYYAQFVVVPDTPGLASKLWLSARPYNMRTAAYDLPPTCSYHNPSFDLPMPGDFWIGTANGVVNQAFNGRMDNISIFTYASNAVPLGCVSK